MSKIKVEFDTVEKTMSVNVDGKSVSDVMEVYFMKQYAEKGEDPAFCCGIMTMSENEDEGMRTYTRMCAAEGIKGKELAKSGLAESAKLPGFIAEPSLSKAQQDVAKFFGG